MTNVNSPRLRMLIGSVRMKRIGRMMAFTSPRMSAAMTADQKSLTTTPASSQPVNIIASELISQEMKIRMSMR